MKKTLCTILVLLSMTSISWASSGPYIGAAPTVTRLEVNDFSDVQAGYRVVGGWRLNENFAFEGSWQDLGGFKDDGFKVDLDGFTAEFLAIAPQFDGLNFFGKVGYFDFTLKEIGFTGDQAEDGLLLGVGLMGDLSNNIGVSLEVNWADAVDDVVFGALTFRWYFLGPN